MTERRRCGSEAPELPALDDCPVSVGRFRQAVRGSQHAGNGFIPLRGIVLKSIPVGQGIQR
jgi:hypothetical protein